MYIPIGEKSHFPTQIILVYQKSILEKFSFWLSLLSLLVLIIYSLGGKYFVSKISKRLLPLKEKAKVSKIQSWWKDEDEEY